MQTKILIGILLIISLIAGIGIAIAHGTNTNNNDNASNSIEGMEEMMKSMMNNEDGNMPMIGMMSNMDEESMEQMMDDEEMRGEMLEHMKSCPMHTST